MFIPIGTDHHDGRIGVVSLVIIVLCLIVHIFINPDIQRVNREIKEVTLDIYLEMADFYQMDEPSEALERHLLLVDSLNEVVPYDDEEVIYESEEDSIMAMLEKEREQMAAMEDPFSVGMYEKSREQRLWEMATQIQVDRIRQTSILFKHGLVSSRITLSSIFTHMFLHADWFHLLGNLWFFYIVGIMMERYWGPIKFLLSYILCGVLSGLGFIVIAEMQGANIETIPLVGASGAIAGMMGGLLVTWHHIKVKLFYWVGFRAGTFEVPIGWYLAIYFIGQLFWGLWWGKYSQVAYMAHVSGFVFGMLFGKLIRGDEIKPEEIAKEGVFDAEHLQAQVKKAEDEEMEMRYSGSEVVAMTAAGVLSDPAREAQMQKRKLFKFPSEEAWNAYRAGDFNKASTGLVAAIDTYLRDVHRFGKNINQDIDRIYEVHKQLQISVEAYYQWAMQFEVNSLKKSALLAYELCAQYASDDVEFRLRSLLKSAELRVETETNLPRAKQVFEFVIANDQKGALRRQAEYALEQLQ